MENNELTIKLDELLAKYNAAKKKLYESSGLQDPEPPKVVWSQIDVDGWEEEQKEYDRIKWQLREQANVAQAEINQILNEMDKLMKVYGAWYRVTGGYIRLSFASKPIGDRRLTYVSDGELLDMLIEHADELK